MRQREKITYELFVLIKNVKINLKNKSLRERNRNLKNIMTK